jgi:hypothetical protein
MERLAKRALLWLALVVGVACAAAPALALTITSAGESYAATVHPSAHWVVPESSLRRSARPTQVSGSVSTVPTPPTAAPLNPIVVT